MRRILCLWLPNWPIQCAMVGLAGRKSRRVGPASPRERTSAGPPEFRKNGGPAAAEAALSHPTPILLHSRDPRRGELVVACNQAAIERGVRLQMPLAEAAALAQHGGECIIQPHDPTADLAALAHLAEHCERFSPIVGWQTAEQVRSAGAPALARVGGVRNSNPDCLFLDVTGIGALFGGEENLAAEVIADIGRLNYTARVAVADTIGAAWAAARQSPKFQVLSLKSHSDLSTRNLELETWNLESLRLPQETLDLLAELGIVRLEQLLALPRESLRARFGERLLLRVDQLLGTAQEMVVPHRPPPQFIEESVLEYPAERREQIEQIAGVLVRRIAEALASRREGVVRLAGRLDCAPGRPVRFEVGLFRPSADSEHLWDLVRMQLEQAMLPGPVGRVRLEATLTAPLENRQGDLFAGGEHEAARQFALLINRCSSRLGPDKVLCPQLTADPLPEKAVRFRKGVGLVRNAERGVRSKGKAKRDAARFEIPHSSFRTPHSALLRPLVLFSPPQLLSAISIVPHGPPVSFQFQGRRYHVAHQSGPERIETGWWRGKSVRRDYWRVETTTGQRFWLFRQLADGQWYLHGEYS
jgi:protein ImuB